jgi:flagellar protein FlaJ
MEYIDERSTRLLQYVSLAFGIILILAIFLSTGFIPESPYWIPIDRRINTGLALSLLIMMSGPAIVEWSNTRYLKSVEENLPIFLRDITKKVHSGVPLMYALESASTMDYGPITKPLRRTMNRINVTSDIEGSLKWLGDQLVVPSAKRLTLVLIEAYNTGGRITDILETSLDIFTVLTKHKNDRESLTNAYIYVVYLGTGVFLIISWVLLSKFLIPLSEITLDPTMQASGLVSSLFNVNYYWAILFWAAVIEAIVGGFLGGKIKYGRLDKGLSFASVMLGITIVFFNSALFG